MNNFEDMITTHKSMIKTDYQLICEYLQSRADEHDIDKVNPGYIRSVYDEHFPTLKMIEFGTEQYKQYEKEHFVEAHRQHAQNRHHYYNPLNKADDVDLFDLLEAIIDIKQSQKQYSDYQIDLIMKTFKDKGVLDLDIEKLAYNTILRIEKLDEEKNEKK